MQITRQRLSSRTLAGLVLCAFTLCLAPLLYLSRYDVPCADDYIFGTAAHLALVHGGNFRDAVAAALEHTAFIYRTWQGSYAAVFLMSLQPAVFSERLYFLTPWLMSVSLFGGLFALCLCLMDKIFGLSRHIGTILAGIIGILYLLLMPYPSETLYWYNGSVYYTFFHGIAMLAIVLAIDTAKRGGALQIAGLSFLAAFLAGGNLVTGLTLCLLALSGIALLLIEKNPAGAKRLLLPSLILLICFCINVFAPGNAVRAASEMTHTPNAVAAILASFQKGLYYSFFWCRLPVLGGMLVLGLLFRAVLPGCSFRFRFPGLVSLWSYCLFSAMFCPPMYAMNFEGPGRMRDMMFFTYLLLLALNLFYWMGWLQQRSGVKEPVSGLPLLPTLGAIALCLVLLAVSAVFRGGISLVSAYTALSHGQAATYYQEAQERLVILKDPSIRVAELKPYSDPPYLLFFDDLYDDPNCWQNRDMANYYEKDKVVLLTEYHG
ncbi:MAG: hypothetical protein IKS55_01800 [Oscillospiraceae bacterium]|nr:hypothetical protein [Oscillospiraceae bacterium]